MTSKEKIEWVIEYIRERARISPPGLIYVSYAPLLDVDANDGLPDGAPVLISTAERRSILRKLEEDRLIIRFGEDGGKGGWFSLWNLNIDENGSPYALSQSGTQLMKEPPIETDLDRGIFAVNGKLVEISTKAGKENNPMRLLKTLLKEPNRYWNEDEILSDWEGRDIDVRRFPKNRVYHSARTLRSKIAEQSGVPDYLDFDTKKYRINPKYLGGL